MFGGFFFRRKDKYYPHVHEECLMSVKFNQKNVYSDEDVIFTVGTEEYTLGTCMFCDRNGDKVVMGEAKLYNKEELKTILSVSEDDEGVIILAAYNRWGKDFAKHLIGDFSFVVYDKTTNELLTVRDHIGHKPLYYFINDEVFAFSNRLNYLSIFDFANELDDFWIINFLQRSHNSFVQDTVYKNIKRLLPACILIVGKEHEQIDKYWDLAKCQTDVPGNLSDAVEHLRWHLQQAVILRTENDQINAVELSGGLDSSTVAAYASKYINGYSGSLIALSNILPQDYRNYFNMYSDEWHKSSLVAKHVGIAVHKGVEHINEEPLSLIKKGISIMGYPTSVMLSLFQSGIYNAARENGVTTLLSGFGGDEVVTTYARGRYMNSLISSGRYYEAFRFAHQHSSSLHKTGVYFGYSVLDNVFNLKDKSSYKLLKNIRKSTPLRDEWLENEIVNKRYFNKPGFLQGPIRQKSINDLTRPDLIERLESGNMMAGSLGIAYRYPFLHVPLIEYFYSLPDSWKADHKNGRAMIRRAMKGILPDTIVEQLKREAVAAGTIPFVKVIVKNHFYELKEYCMDIPASHKAFNYIDKAKIAKLEYDDRRSYGYDSLLSLAAISMFIDAR